MASKKTPADNDALRWKREAEKYRPVGDALLVIGRQSCLDYLSILGCVRYIAENGVTRQSFDSLSRPDEKGRRRNHWNGSDGMQASTIYLGGESTPPKYDPAVMAKLKAEEAWMRRRAEALTAWLDEHVGESSIEYVRRSDAA